MQYRVKMSMNFKNQFCTINLEKLLKPVIFSNALSFLQM
jgi:hypothetical protein